MASRFVFSTDATVGNVLFGHAPQVCSPSKTNPPSLVAASVTVAGCLESKDGKVVSR